MPPWPNPLAVKIVHLTNSKITQMADAPGKACFYNGGGVPDEIRSAHTIGRQLVPLAASNACRGPE